MRPPQSVPDGGEALPCDDDLCWGNVKASWCCPFIVTAPSSSLLSDPQEDAELELVSMETTDSESWGYRGEDGLEHDGESEVEEEAEEEEDDEEELASLLIASMGSGGLWSSCSMSFLLIMLFMAFCISSSILCFSLLGMRPNLTAGSKNIQKWISLRTQTSSSDKLVPDFWFFLSFNSDLSQRD